MNILEGYDKYIILRSMQVCTAVGLLLIRIKRNGPSRSEDTE